MIVPTNRKITNKQDWKWYFFQPRLASVLWFFIQIIWKWIPCLTFSTPILLSLAISHFRRTTLKTLRNEFSSHFLFAESSHAHELCMSCIALSALTQSISDFCHAFHVSDAFTIDICLQHSILVQRFTDQFSIAF